MTNTVGKSARIAGMLLASGLLAQAGACRADAANQLADNAEIQAPSALAALLQFAYEHGVCVGIEAPGLDLLQGLGQVHVAHSAAGDVLRALLKEKPYQSSEKGGVVLVRSADSTSRVTQLDVVVPEFKMPRATLASAEALLFQGIRLSLDPSIKGFAGSVLGDVAEVGPLDEHERSAREILTLLASQAGGAWVSGLCPVAADSSSKACWTIIPYDSDPEVFKSEVRHLVAKLLAERNSRK
jgi:hypothetical protein